ncbi:MAG: transporter, partial [Acidobacteriota bacterium]
MSRKVAWLALLLAVCAAPAGAQSTGTQTTQPPATPAPATPETRPATTTFMGDTGLWFVPTGEVLPAKKWSFSLYRANFDFNQGFTDVSIWPVTAGVGIRDRAELFFAAQSVVRIDRDLRPIFNSNPQFGGAVVNYPTNRQGWSSNQFGDIYAGAKVNLLSQHRQQPAAFAIRGMVKIPTADDQDGAGTGAVDLLLDAIVSKEFNDRVEFSGFGGIIYRGDSNDFDLPGGFRWGFGAGFPTRKSLRFTAELHGEAYFDEDLKHSGTDIIGVDGSVMPQTSSQQSP